MKKILLAIPILLSLAACDKYDGDTHHPSYLQINAFTVEDTPGDSWSQDDGFFTSDIDAVNVTFYVAGDTAETLLGTFQLPCRIPVLREGVLDYVRIVPVVKQDGIAGKRIAYPFYKTITLDSVIMKRDSVTDLGNMVTRYISRNTMRVAWQEFFEPPAEITLDSVVLRCTSPDTVRSGYGCGVIRVPQGTTSVSFGYDTTINIPDPSAIVYLEMDYWSDIDFTVGLNNPISQGGANMLYSHETLYGKPQQGWAKIYINIGSLWSKTYLHYPNIRPYFTILNDDGKAGNLFLDNIKLIVM